MMTATNHALAGALIASVLPLPLAIPVAFLSHFALDALPHFGFKKKHNTSTRVKLLIMFDSLLALSLNIPAIIFHKWSMLLCAWVAYSPDIPIVYHYFKHKNMDGNHHWPFKRRLFTLPHNEYPWGIIPEGFLAVILGIFFVSALR